VTKHRQFITLARSIIACLIGMTACAMTFFPAHIAASTQPIFVLLELGLVRFVEAEFSAALMGLAIFPLPIFLFYLAGMSIAKTLRTRLWSYFATTGIALSSGLRTAINFLPHHRVDLHSGLGVVSPARCTYRCDEWLGLLALSLLDVRA
jgi:hypothetical protein